MWTVCGVGRRVQRLVRRVRRSAAPVPVAEVRPLAGGRRPLISDRLGEQRHMGARLDQVDGTTCGSAVLVALAAWADPAELRRLEAGTVGEPSSGTATPSGAGAPALARTAGGIAVGFGSRFDARQHQVHHESTRFWPRSLGTTPWGMTRWLRRNASAAGPYRVRLVDDTSDTDISRALAHAGAALAAGRPVPVLVGSIVPRHYCMALSRAGTDTWRVYEPTSGQVRELDLGLVRARALTPVLGFGRLHALLLPL
jgi:hypothetical protein